MTIDPKKRDVALVVDDSPETLRLLTDALDGAGMTVMVALDGASAMRIVDQITPDIVLLDAVMPGMDGWTVAETLRANGHHSARILMVSASALEAHGAPLAQPFHDGYLMKPIDIPRLLETIRQLLKLDW